MNKLKPENLPTQEDLDLRKAEMALRAEAISKIVNDNGWKYVKEVFEKHATEEELKKLLADKSVTDFNKIGELVYLEHRANKKIESAIIELEKYK